MKKGKFGPTVEENYASKVQPRLGEIRKWRRSGYGVKQVASMLGIGYSTMRDYALRFPELEEALKRGQKELIIELEDALFRKALGYEYEETQEHQEIRDGRVVATRRNITRKTAHPDTGALAFALKNQAPAKWADYAARKIGLDSEEQQIRIEKLKAETEHMRVVTNLKSGETGEEMARQQTAAIADMINSPEADRVLADFLGDNDE